MYGQIFALLLAVIIILVTLIKSRTAQIHTHYCKKSEIPKLLENISDDAVVQISIERNAYEHERNRNT